MAIFHTKYYHPMDQEYIAPIPAMGTNDVDVSVKDIGQSIVSGIGGALPQHLAAKIRAGVGAVELEFTGAGSTRGQQHTPDVYGKDMRQAIRELAKLNEINLTTHATMGIMGVAGQDQNLNFSKESQKFAIDEVKRAIEFAAEAAGGGAVTVHSGEFQRPISDLPQRVKGATRPDGTPLFVNYHDENPEDAAKRAMIYAVDKRTGKVRFAERRTFQITVPEWKQAQPGQEYYDEQGNKRIARKGETIYLDYHDREIPIKTEDDLFKRVPLFDPQTGEFKVQTVTWDYFENEAKIRNDLFKKQHGRDPTPEEAVTPEEAFVRSQYGVQAARARGFALRELEHFPEYQEKLKKMEEALKIYKKLEQGASEEEKERLKVEVGDRLGLKGLLPSEYKYPSEIIEKTISDIKTQLKYLQEASSSQFAEAKDIENTAKQIVSVYKYGIKEAQKAYAEIGLHAWNKTKEQKLEKPVFVAIEHIFPESYGGHPQELKEIIIGARQEMQKRLEKWGHTPEEAKKIAETHIKGTLDIGHLNMWRKYFNADPKKKPEENDAEFKKWVVGQVEDLAKDKIWGNVHLTDNYGYGDDHLAPGTGNAPTREIVKVLKKHGYDAPLIVEPGADASVDLSDFHGTMKAWRYFGSPIYGLQVPAHERASWENVQYNWFGQTRSPYFIFGAYAPSQEWKLWTEVPLE